MQSLCLSRVNFTNLDDTMIQILLLRLCWQLTSCAILKILEYHSKILPRRNTCREKTPKAAQPVTRPHVIYWRLLVHLPELSIFHRTGQISAIICTNEGIPMLLIKYFYLSSPPAPVDHQLHRSHIRHIIDNFTFCIMMSSSNSTRTPRELVLPRASHCSSHCSNWSSKWTFS